MWSIFEPFGKGYLKASIIHDYLYSKDCVYKSIDRKLADRIFLKIMEESGLGFIKRYLFYEGVRIFGGRYWKKD